MQNNRRNKRIFLMNTLMVTGAVLWTLTVLLRGTDIIQVKAVRQVLGVMPNFAAVWSGFGLFYHFFPLVCKRQFNWGYSLFLLLGILTVLLLSEIIHHFFLDSPFDIWDIAASLAASFLLYLAILATKKTEQ